MFYATIITTMLRFVVFSLWSLIVGVILNAETTAAWISFHQGTYPTRPNFQLTHMRPRRTAATIAPNRSITTALPSSSVEESLFVPDGFVPFVLVVALFLGFAANGWISQLLNGKEKKSGLGAFLKDGPGYNRSGFAMQDSDRAVQKDPLPWLKLPTLDFVEVAGQEKPEDTLERLRLDLNAPVAKGDILEAKCIERQLEDIMKKTGVQFQSDEH